MTMTTKQVPTNTLDNHDEGDDDQRGHDAAGPMTALGSDGEDDEEGTDAAALWGMHQDRVALTEDHVMWARKQNLYNETFNTESMADVLWSHQL